jgi:hypothetical protein
LADPPSQRNTSNGAGYDGDDQHQNVHAATIERRRTNG